jgi:hypothetical protein
MRLLILILLFPLFTSGADYYFANAGNDANPGTQLSPKQHLSAADVLLQTAGTRIFLNRGDVFIGNLHFNANSGSLLAYGSGANPIITGFIQLTSWTSRGSNLYQAYCPTCQAITSVVQFNNYDQPMGRFPDTTAINGGYLTYTSPTSTSIVADVTDPTTNWAGATIVVRVNNFSMDPATITSESGGVINFTPALVGVPITGYGYFIQNDIRTLSTVGEWFWKSSVDSLIMDFAGTTPSANQVSVSSGDTLISIGASNIKIDGVDLKGCNKFLVAFTSASSNDTIRNDTLSYAGIDAINIPNASATIVKDCSFDHINFLNIHNNGITAVYPAEIDSTQITDNSFTNMAIIPGAGLGGNAYYVAITHYGNRDSILRNTFYNIGGVCCQIFGGDNNCYRYNYFHHFNTILCDAGAIYASVHDGLPNYILDNICIDGVGQHSGTTLPANTYSTGIYLDNGAQNWDVERNTAAYCSYNGLFDHFTKNCIELNNTCFKNTGSQFYFQEDNSGTIMRGNIFKYNKLISGDSSSLIIAYYIASNNDLNLIGTLDSNILTRPVRKTTPFKNNGGGGSVFNLQKWQSLTGQDAHSKDLPTAINNDSQMLLFYNATMLPSVVSLPQGYCDATGLPYAPGNFTLQPFQSLVLIQLPIYSYFGLSK